jgi:hypothetical protein
MLTIALWASASVLNGPMLFRGAAGWLCNHRALVACRVELLCSPDIEALELWLSLESEAQVHRRV